MELSRLVETLSDPAAYPFAVETIAVHQTHISVVFLAGAFAYKIRKPVNFGFLDFSTLEKRLRDCAAEVRLNRRLAPDVYLGVVPITVAGDGVKVEGKGDPIEWAVKMERLSDEANLHHRLSRGDAGTREIEALAVRVAAFHAGAAAGSHISEFGRYEVVARNCRENFEQSAAQVGTIVSPQVFARLQDLTENALATQRALIEARAARGVPRDTHGDLRLDHVYLFPDRIPPADLAIIDCIEFNERFRFADPIADMAFLTMELESQGERHLASAFRTAYLRASGDAEGGVLIDLYTSYRAAVRGKVEGMKALQPEIMTADRTESLALARRFWLLALSELEQPARRPCLVLVGGLPGAGKSTLARDLSARAGFEVIRSDVVRKELAGASGQQTEPPEFGQGIYSPDWTARTYAECLCRAEPLLFEGRRVLIDASFREENQRVAGLQVARRLGVPATMFICHAEPEVIRLRLAARRNDVSDADWSIYLQAAAAWQPNGSATRSRVNTIDTGATREESLERVLGVLRDAGLF